MWNLKCDKQMNLSKKQKLTDIENRLMVAKGEEGEGERCAGGWGW